MNGAPIMAKFAALVEVTAGAVSALFAVMAVMRKGVGHAPRPGVPDKAYALEPKTATVCVQGAHEGGMARGAMVVFFFSKRESVTPSCPASAQCVIESPLRLNENWAR